MSTLLKFKSYLRQNGLFILFLFALLIITFNPSAKGWLLRQALSTGFFNASISDADTGSTANFSYTDERGKIYKVAELRGKIVLINFWASWCPPCRAEMPTLQKLYKRLNDNEKIVFVILNEDNDTLIAKRFLKNNNIALPFYQALHGVPGSLYSGGLPTTIILDKKGSVRYRHEGMINFGADDFIEQLKQLANE